jgi:hypothetical protein
MGTARMMVADIFVVIETSLLFDLFVVGLVEGI